jgi:hypothetical protein
VGDETSENEEIIVGSGMSKLFSWPPWSLD